MILAKPRKEPKVLIVEDSIPSIIIFKNYLKQSGKGHICAVSGREALSLLAGEEIDLCLVDLHLPDMEGRDLIREIRSQISSSLPVIGLLSEKDHVAREQCLQAGMNGVLVKPVDQDTFTTVLEKWTAPAGNALNGAFQRIHHK